MMTVMCYKNRSDQRSLRKGYRLILLKIQGTVGAAATPVPKKASNAGYRNPNLPEKAF